MVEEERQILSQMASKRLDSRFMSLATGVLMLEYAHTPPFERKREIKLKLEIEKRSGEALLET